ncbi:MAG: helix-turn-helix transcriptional regulator [bacterium]|nr:helix-turn-helix transcriptional regulator [bacterium]
MDPTTTTGGIRSAADLGRIIRERRKRDGLTLVETAGLTNVGVRFLSELENGKPTVRLDKLLRVLGALGLELRAGDRDGR